MVGGHGAALPLGAAAEGVGELPAGVPENRHGLRADLLVFELMPRGIVARAARVADAELGTEIAPPAAARALWMGATRDQTPLKAAAHHFHGSNAGNFFSMLRNGIFIASRTEFMTAGNVLGDGAYFGRCYETSRGYSSAGSVEEPLGRGVAVRGGPCRGGRARWFERPPAAPLAAKEAAAGDPHADEGAAAGPPQRAQRPAACCINHALRPIVVAIAALDPGSPEEQAGGAGCRTLDGPSLQSRRSWCGSATYALSRGSGRRVLRVFWFGVCMW